MALLSMRNIKRAEKVAIKLILNRSQFITFLRVCVFVYRLGMGESGIATAVRGKLNTSVFTPHQWKRATDQPLHVTNDLLVLAHEELVFKPPFESWDDA